MFLDVRYNKNGFFYFFTKSLFPIGADSDEDDVEENDDGPPNDGAAGWRIAQICQKMTEELELTRPVLEMAPIFISGF